jgi:hypothetical protein
VIDDSTNDSGQDLPDFELPVEVTRDETQVGQPGDTAQNAQPPVAPAAGGTQPPATAAPGGATDPNGESATIPKYRFDEVSARANEQAAQIANLTAILNRLTTQPQAATPTTQPPAQPESELSPQDQAIRDRMLAIVPELALLAELKGVPIADLKELVGAKTNLLGITERVGTWASREEAEVNRYVDNSLASVYNKAAAFVLGEGKTGKDLNPMVRDNITNAMSRFVSSDPARAARFENQDPTVIDEFWTAYKAATYDPIKRDQRAAVLTRAGNPHAVPQGGTQPPPAPPSPKPSDSADVDAIYGEAWNRRAEVGAR